MKKLNYLLICLLSFTFTACDTFETLPNKYLVKNDLIIGKWKIVNDNEHKYINIKIGNKDKEYIVELVKYNGNIDTVNTRFFKIINNHTVLELEINMLDVDTTDMTSNNKYIDSNKMKLKNSKGYMLFKVVKISNKKIILNNINLDILQRIIYPNKIKSLTSEVLYMTIKRNLNLLFLDNQQIIINKYETI